LWRLPLTASTNSARSQTRKYLTGLFHTFELLSDISGIGRTAPELGENLRRFEHGRHSIFYITGPKSRQKSAASSTTAATCTGNSDRLGTKSDHTGATPVAVAQARKVMECTIGADLSAERNEPVSLPLNTTPTLKAMAG
jgi:hypothetical protein